MRRTMMLVFLVLLGSVITACGGTAQVAAPSASDVRITATPTTTATGAPDIDISNFTYTVRGPVKAGQQVTVVNDDDPSHSVTADAGNEFDIRVSGGGGTSTFTAPATPGTYAFHCKYHSNMHGTLVVQ